MLSAGVLGISSLLYPFQWCLALVPILPESLIEMLEAPLPFLVGITKHEYNNITLSDEERDSKVWVFLDTGIVKWPKYQIWSKFSFNNLQKEISEDFLHI